MRIRLALALALTPGVLAAEPDPWNDHVVEGSARWRGDVAIRPAPEDPLARPSRLVLRPGAELRVGRATEEEGEGPGTGDALRVRPSLLTAESGSVLRIEDGAALIVEPGASLRVVAGATLEVLGSGRIEVRDGAWLAVERDARCHFEGEGALRIGPEAQIGMHPDLGLEPPSARNPCDIEFEGEGTVLCGRVCPVLPGGVRTWFTFDQDATTDAEIFTAIDGAGGGRGEGRGEHIEGRINGALRLNGGGSIRVPSTDGMQVGEGDFSIAMWVRTEVDDRGVSVLLDKRNEWGTFRGYHVFLYRGELSMQLMADGGHTNYVSKAHVADGKWHHVAVTVDRDDPTGGRWYVDGVQVERTFNPTAKRGSLDNDNPLVIGARESGGGAFVGDIDELMIFDRLLEPEELSVLAYGNPTGPELESLEVPEVNALTPFEPTVLVPITITNDTDLACTYRIEVIGRRPELEGEVYGPVAEEVELLDGSEVTVQPAEEVVLRARIGRPTELRSSDQSAGFRVIATNRTKGTVLSAEGRLLWIGPEIEDR